MTAEPRARRKIAEDWLVAVLGQLRWEQRTIAVADREFLEAAVELQQEVDCTAWAVAVLVETAAVLVGPRQKIQ